MNRSHTLSIQTQTTPDQVVVSPSEQDSHGGGLERPGVCESPALTPEASRHTNSSETNNLFTFDTPLGKRVDGDGRAPAVTVQFTTDCTRDLELFLTLADRKDYDALTQLCRERLLTARDGLTALRWTKDRAIVECYQGNYTAAYDLLASAHYLASGVTGRARGKYENEFGVVLARLGRSSLAIDRFGLAYQNARSASDLFTCARVDHNRARALMTRGETVKAQKYLKRALDYARANDDFRLEMEICQTRVEFESRGTYERLKKG